MNDEQDKKFEEELEKLRKLDEALDNTTEEDWGGKSPINTREHWLERMKPIIEEFSEEVWQTPGAKKVLAILDMPEETKIMACRGNFAKLILDDLMDHKNPKGRRIAMSIAVQIFMRLKRTQDPVEDLMLRLEDMPTDGKVN